MRLMIYRSNNVRLTKCIAYANIVTMSIKDTTTTSNLDRFALYFEYDKSWREAKSHTKQRVMPEAKSSK